MKPYPFAKTELSHLEEAGLYRRQVDFIGPQGRQMNAGGESKLIFCSNDYLGLAASRRLIAALKRGAEQSGVGAGASRLVCGNLDSHRCLEIALAEFKGAEDAIVFPSGYMANLGLVSVLASRGDLVILDKLSHASLIDGARLSGASLRAFPHKNYKRLAEILETQRSCHKKAFILTDSIFSMDGDLADLPRMLDIAERYDAEVIVDEAHATGVWGKKGRGVAEYFGVEDRLIYSMGTLSKALGSQGGFVCGSKEAIELLRNRARSYIYTTGLMPALAEVALEALKIVSEGEKVRQRLLLDAAEFRAELVAAGLNILSSESQIIPILTGDNRRTMKAAAALWERGFMVAGIRYPTVPKAAGRLRVSLTSEHTKKDREDLLKALQEVLG